MATSLLLLLTLLLSVGFSSVPFFALAYHCYSDEFLREGDVRAIKTEDARHVRGTTDIATTVYVKPKGGFQGVGLQVEDEYGEYQRAWFPIVPTDQCLPQRGEWGEMKMGAWMHGNFAPYRLRFWLRYGGCIKACEENNYLRSFRNLSVVAHGPSEWRRTKPGASCSIKTIFRSANPIPSICLQPPLPTPTPTRIITTNHTPTTPFSHSTTPTATTTLPSNTPSSHPSSPPTAHRETSTFRTVVAVVVVVGVVVVAVVVAVVVWRMRRRGSPPSCEYNVCVWGGGVTTRIALIK